MNRRFSFVVSATVLGGFLQACVATKPLPPPAPRESACERFFDGMDRLVTGLGVSDGGTARIPGFPELRIDRFLASFAHDEMPAEAYADWVGRLRKLDAAGRRIELRNLPPGAAAEIQAPFDLDIGTAVEVCGQVLAERDLKSPARRRDLIAHAEVPDAYTTWQRWVGLYPLTRWLVAEGVGTLHRDLRQPFLAGAAERPVAAPVVRYAPSAGTPAQPEAIAGILEDSSHNPLAIPEPSADQLQRLFASFAPIFAVETASGDDRIGAVRLNREGKGTVDPSEPVVYRLASHTRMGGRTLLQLNYVIWFPARPSQGFADIYAGRFDGLIWRVTLGEDGRPWAYDSIHPCGCYYQVFPGPGVRAVQPEDGSEPILSPTPIPRLASGERLTIRMAPRTHFIQGVGPEQAETAATAYAWRDYDALRSLPLPGGGHGSLFAADGLVPGSERPERFLLWPMGVPSPGAMRQWGTHAIAFLGRRHFDDPDLLEKLLRPLED